MYACTTRTVSSGMYALYVICVRMYTSVVRVRAVLRRCMYVMYILCIHIRPVQTYRAKSVLTLNALRMHVLYVRTVLTVYLTWISLVPFFLLMMGWEGGMASSLGITALRGRVYSNTYIKPHIQVQIEDEN
jgi:hypothetical protein